MTFDVADLAHAAREVAVLTAATLIRVHGDAEAAIEMLAEFSARTPPEGEALDAAGIAAQAVRDALALGVTPQ